MSKPIVQLVVIAFMVVFGWCAVAIAPAFASDSPAFAEAIHALGLALGVLGIPVVGFLVVRVWSSNRV